MRRIAHIALLGALLGFVGLWVAAFADTTTDIAVVDKLGWWTRRPGAMAYGNPNNFEVAAGAQGDESIAALRVLIRGTITKATLILAESDAPLASVNPGKLRVCTTSVPWLVVDGGAFAVAPKPDCSAAVELKRTTDAVSGVGTWSGDVTSMLAGARSEVTLMVVPSPDAAAVIPATYYIKLAGRVDAQGTPDAPTSPLVSPPPPPTVASVTPTAPRVTSPGAVVTAPAATTPTTAAAAAASATPTSTPSRFKLAAQPKEHKHWGRLIWLLPLAAFFAFVYTAGQKLWAQRLEAATT